MDQVIADPQLPERGNFLTRTYHGFKHTASITGNFVKILFNIGIAIFLITLLAGLITGNDKGDSSLFKTLYGSGKDEIAVINLTGEILDAAPSGPFDAISENTVITPRKVLLALEDIKKSPQVKAVILKINSPGGSVTASDEIYETIKRFGNETKIPVFASMSEVAASGGYYISLASNTIMANPTTLTGSIGVIAHTYNLKELADKYGIKEVTVASGTNKNFLSPLKETSEEEKAILKSIIDEAYQQFLTRVRESRKIDESTLVTYADGRPLSGLQAEQLKLIDKTGSFHDAVEAVRTQINAPDAKVVEYGTGSVLENLLKGVMKPFVRSELHPLLILEYFSGKPAYLYH